MKTQDQALRQLLELSQEGPVLVGVTDNHCRRGVLLFRTASLERALQVRDALARGAGAVVAQNTAPLYGDWYEVFSEAA